jgi:hypothetical protein
MAPLLSFFWVTTTTSDHPSLAANASGGVLDFLGNYSYHHPLACSNVSRGVSCFILGISYHPPLCHLKREEGLRLIH